MSFGHYTSSKQRSSYFLLFKEKNGDLRKCIFREYPNIAKIFCQLDLFKNIQCLIKIGHYKQIVPNYITR